MDSREIWETVKSVEDLDDTHRRAARKQPIPADLRGNIWYIASGGKSLKNARPDLYPMAIELAFDCQADNIDQTDGSPMEKPLGCTVDLNAVLGVPESDDVPTNTDDGDSSGVPARERPKSLYRVLRLVIAASPNLEYAPLVPFLAAAALRHLDVMKTFYLIMATLGQSASGPRPGAGPMSVLTSSTSSASSSAASHTRPTIYRSRKDSWIWLLVLEHLCSQYHPQAIEHLFSTSGYHGVFSPAQTHPLVGAISGEWFAALPSSSRDHLLDSFFLEGWKPLLRFGRTIVSLWNKILAMAESLSASRRNTAANLQHTAVGSRNSSVRNTATAENDSARVQRGSMATSKKKHGSVAGSLRRRFSRTAASRKDRSHSHTKGHKHDEGEHDMDDWVQVEHPSPSHSSQTGAQVETGGDQQNNHLKLDPEDADWVSIDKSDLSSMSSTEAMASASGTIGRSSGPRSRRTFSVFKNKLKSRLPWRRKARRHARELVFDDEMLNRALEQIKQRMADTGTTFEPVFCVTYSSEALIPLVHHAAMTNKEILRLKQQVVDEAQLLVSDTGRLLGVGESSERSGAAAVQLRQNVAEELAASSGILKEAWMWRGLWPALPLRHQLSSPCRVFSTHDQGYSFRSLVDACDRVSPIIISMRTSQGDCFGAFLTHPWAERRKADINYFGSGECFVWRVLPAEEKVEVFPWRGRQRLLPNEPSQAPATSYFVAVNDGGLLIGGGGGTGHAIELDSGMKNGSSAQNTTFANPSLMLSNEDRFELSQLEVHHLDGGIGQPGRD